MAFFSNNNTSISNFYSGKSVLVTGGSGFIGKVLVEKLLYSCNDINKIYILIRGKENASGDERLKEIINSPAFERLRQNNPKILKKIFNIEGDLTKNNLGINVEDEKTLIEEVSVVIHLAATVKFDEKLDVSVKLNYEGTKKVLSLCHRMKNLKSFVYISTAFVNPHITELQEMIYPVPVKPDELQTFLDQKGMEDKEKLARFLGVRPNTYTLTKSLAECYVASHHGAIPTAIVRPSIGENECGGIRTSSWMDRGLVIRVCPYRHLVPGLQPVGSREPANVMDITPVDYVANLTIAVAAAKKEKSSLKVFNSCTSSCNPVTLEYLYQTTKRLAVANGHYKMPMPFVLITENTIMGGIVESLLEKLPLKLADTWRQINGKKPVFGKIQTKVIENRELSKPFTSRSFSMSADNTIALFRSLSEKDAKAFPFNPTKLNWVQYLPVNYWGIRKYLLKK